MNASNVNNSASKQETGQFRTLTVTGGLIGFISQSGLTYTHSRESLLFLYRPHSPFQLFFSHQTHKSAYSWFLALFLTCSLSTTVLATNVTSDFGLYCTTCPPRTFVRQCHVLHFPALPLHFHELLSRWLFLHFWHPRKLYVSPYAPTCSIRKYNFRHRYM